MCQVVHCKKSKHDVYIGRPSKWGNPFTIGVHGNREEVIAKYEEYLLHNDYLLESLHELHNKVLGCWCAPAACHGDVLAKYAKLVEGRTDLNARQIRLMIKSNEAEKAGPLYKLRRHA